MFLKLSQTEISTEKYSCRLSIDEEHILREWSVWSSFRGAEKVWELSNSCHNAIQVLHRLVIFLFLYSIEVGMSILT